ncbi:MAG: class I SAM-dependent methyltransferase family protein [Promethearchaeota archaeon]
MENNNAPEILYIRMKKEYAQVFINYIKNNFKNTQFINQKFKILHENEYLLFPIFSNQVLINSITETLEKQIKFEVITREGIPNKDYKHRTLQEALEDKIPDKYSDLIPKSYDIIGHIAVVEFDKFIHYSDEEFNNYKKMIAEAISDVNKNVETVYQKKSHIKGKYRLRELELLYGEDKSETIHKENDCIFKLDIKNTYFSPRLVFERQRIASSIIKEKELIIDMFAGVGTFSIQIAKKWDARIYAFDVNPNAVRYLKENVKINKLKGEITVENIDVRDLLEPNNQLGKILFHKADRIIMNLPENSINFIDVACFLIKESGGNLHFYQFSEKPNPIKKTLETLEIQLANLNWEIESVSNLKIVKHYSPKSELVVIDSKIKSVIY